MRMNPIVVQGIVADALTLDQPVPLPSGVVEQEHDRSAGMNNFHEQYLVDEHGSRNAIVLPLADWQRILEDMEELDDIRAYDEAKGRPSEPVAFEQAVREIRQGTGR